MLLFPFIVTVNGFVEPDASPLQFINVYPLDGLAVTVAELPELYVPVPDVVPPLVGLADAVREYVCM